MIYGLADRAEANKLPPRASGRAAGPEPPDPAVQFLDKREV